MNDGLKQRIIGAMVLIALGVIFVPVIFDKKRIEPVDRVSLIPPEPDIEMAPALELEQVDIRRDDVISSPITGDFNIESVDDERESDAPAQEKSSDTTSTLPERPDQVPENTASIKPKIPAGRSQAWVLQIASFSDEKRAKAIRQELSQMDYKTFIKNTDTKNGRRSRVFIGPSINKSGLEEAKLKLDKKYAVDSLLLKFSP